MKESRAKDEPKADEASESANAAESVDTKEGRGARNEKIAKHHILSSMGVGLIPIPIVDVVALIGIQLNMVRKLSAEYNIPFKKDIGKSVITSLVGGFLSTEIGFILCSLIKCIPVIGQTAGAVTMPVVAGAATYAIYKVFVQHFEAGGTFLDLDPAKVKTYFKEQFTRGKKVVTDMKAEQTGNSAA